MSAQRRTDLAKLQRALTAGDTAAAAKAMGIVQFPGTRIDEGLLTPDPLIGACDAAHGAVLDAVGACQSAIAALGHALDANFRMLDLLDALRAEHGLPPLPRAGR